MTHITWGYLIYIYMESIKHHLVVKTHMKAVLIYVFHLKIHYFPEPGGRWAFPSKWQIPYTNLAISHDHMTDPAPKYINIYKNNQTLWNCTYRLPGMCTKYIVTVLPCISALTDLFNTTKDSHEHSDITKNHMV